MGPKSKDCYKRGERETRYTEAQRRQCEDGDRDQSAVSARAKNCGHPQEPRREARDRFSLGVSIKDNTADTLISDF